MDKYSSLFFIKPKYTPMINRTTKMKKRSLKEKIAVYALYTTNEFTYKEISDLLRIPFGTVKCWVSMGGATLENELLSMGILKIKD